MIVEEILRHVDSDVTFVEGAETRATTAWRSPRHAIAWAFSCRYTVTAVIPQIMRSVAAGLFPKVNEMCSHFGSYEMRAGISLLATADGWGVRCGLVPSR